MHLYILSYFVCALYLTNSLRLFKPHLAWQMHYQSPFTLNAIKIWIILTRNEMYTRDGDIYCECARGCDASACAAGNKRIVSESASRETDRPVTDTGRSSEKSSNSNHWPVNQCIFCLLPRSIFTSYSKNRDSREHLRRFHTASISRRKQRIFFSAPMLTDESVHTAVRSRSGAEQERQCRNRFGAESIFAALLTLN